MSKPPVSGNTTTTTTSDHLQTWILKVYIHCEGCRKKVFKVLQSIDGVYKTVIDSKQHKVTVTGSVHGDTLVQKLLKSGKHAEILPESFEVPAAADNASGNQKKKKKKKQSNKQDGVTTGEFTEQVHCEKDEYEGVTIDGADGENDQKTAHEAAIAGGPGISNGGGSGGKKKKNKKKKGDKTDSNAKNGDTEGLVTENPPADTGVQAENVEASMEQLNLGRPGHQMVYSTPYDVPPYNNYYPTPAYGVSYSTSNPSAESSYYTPPVYGYAQSHPSVSNYPVRPPTSYYGRSAFDEHDDEGSEGRGCIIM